MSSVKTRKPARHPAKKARKLAAKKPATRKPLEAVKPQEPDLTVRSYM